MECNRGGAGMKSLPQRKKNDSGKRRATRRESSPYSLRSFSASPDISRTFLAPILLTLSIGRSVAPSSVHSLARLPVPCGWAKKMPVSECVWVCVFEFVSAWAWVSVFILAPPPSLLWSFWDPRALVVSSSGSKLAPASTCFEQESEVRNVVHAKWGGKYGSQTAHSQSIIPSEEL